MFEYLTESMANCFACMKLDSLEEAKAEMENRMRSDLTYGDFFRHAPALNPDRRLISGTICGVRVENIETPLMQEIRYLDKLVDELAKGKKWNGY